MPLQDLCLEGPSFVDECALSSSLSGKRHLDMNLHLQKHTMASKDNSAGIG